MSMVKRLTPEQAFQKVKYYCSYQERSHAEVRTKLYSYGLWKSDVEQLLTRLIEDNYLNEERFACHFAGGKFRIKQWGRMKITQALKEKQVSPYCIKKAMKEIDEKDYLQVLEKLAAKKWASIRGVGINRFVKMSKTTDFLLQRGFEVSLVREVVGRIGVGE